MRLFLKWVLVVTFFVSWKIFAACSPYIGKATINEIYKQGGNNGNAFVEVALITPVVSPSIHNNWKVKICHSAKKGGAVCDVISLSVMNDDIRWLWAANPIVDRTFLDFQNGFDFALLDENDAFIDYIQIDNYSAQNFAASCGYSNLQYVFNIPATTTNGTKILLRKPNGTGSWIEDKNTNTYPSTPGDTNDDKTSVDHFEIHHDGNGLTCDSETVTLKACADASCTTLSSDPVSLDFLADGAVISSPTFTGSTTVSFNNTDAETLTFSVANASIAAANAFVCNDGSGTSCDMVFADAGFRFLSGAGNSLTIPNQTSGVVFPDTLKLQAVENTNGVCTGLFSGNRNVDLSQENVDPGGVSGLSFSINSSTVAKHPSVTNITLNFGANSIATIPTPFYNDAGQIRLHANYNVGGVILTGSSNSFWVSPAELVVTAKSGTSNLNGATATATTTFAAGDSFDLSVSALNSLGVVTPNYSPGQIQLMLTRIGPTLTGSVDGNLTYATASSLVTSTSPVFQNVTLSSFSSGVSTFNAAHYSEVGLLNLDVQDNNYGNASIVVPATDINIGRFVPEHFKQTVAKDGVFQATCDTRMAFTAYSGQKDEATQTNGAISYLTNPVFAITAYNKQGNITQNYYQDSQGSANDYMKLSVSDVSVSVPTLDLVAVGVDANKLPLTADMNAGTLSQNDLTVLPSVVALPRGVLHYQLSDADNFFYNRSANALVAPFTSDIDFSIATLSDSDSVNATTTTAASPTGVEVRFGRLVLENSFGPETSNFPQPMQLEHFDGTGFVASSDNDCLSYDDSKISLSNISLAPSLTNVTGGTGNFLDGKTQAIELEAPGAGNQGQIGVSYDAYDWLKFDWDNDGNYDDSPTSVATFGIYRGNDRIIHWREVFN